MEPIPRDTVFYILTVKRRGSEGSDPGDDDSPTTDVIQGTLDMLILKALSLEPMHGFGVARRIEQTSRGVFKVNPGSLLVAFQRLERAGWIDADWQTSDTGRRAKDYALTADGRRQLDVETANWSRRVAAVARLLRSRRPRSMSLWRQLTRGVRVLTRREAADDELDEELRDYLDQATEAYIERGRSPAEARRAARRDMGSTVSVREQVRDHGWENVVSTLVTDTRFAGRMLRKSRIFTLVIVIVIGLGSGAVTTIFSAMNATVLRPCLVSRSQSGW